MVRKKSFFCDLKGNFNKLIGSYIEDVWEVKLKSWTTGTELSLKEKNRSPLNELGWHLEEIEIPKTIEVAHIVQYRMFYLFFFKIKVL
jgi:hypothetical protein